MNDIIIAIFDIMVLSFLTFWMIGSFIIIPLSIQRKIETRKNRYFWGYLTSSKIVRYQFKNLKKIDYLKMLVFTPSIFLILIHNILSYYVWKEPKKEYKTY